MGEEVHKGLREGLQVVQADQADPTAELLNLTTLTKYKGMIIQAIIIPSQGFGRQVNKYSGPEVNRVGFRVIKVL